jgi:hypothetical protein
MASFAEEEGSIATPRRIVSDTSTSDASNNRQVSFGSSLAG